MRFLSIAYLFLSIVLNILFKISIVYSCHQNKEIITLTTSKQLFTHTNSLNCFDFEQPILLAFFEDIQRIKSTKIYIWGSVKGKLPRKCILENGDTIKTTTNKIQQMIVSYIIKKKTIPIISRLPQYTIVTSKTKCKTSNFFLNMKEIIMGLFNDEQINMVTNLIPKSKHIFL